MEWQGSASNPVLIRQLQLVVEAVDLSPVLHSEHLFLLGSPDRPEHRPEPGLRSGRASRSSAGEKCPVFAGVDTWLQEMLQPALRPAGQDQDTHEVIR